MRTRTVIVAGPRRGKSTLAAKLRAEHPGYLPLRCGDPISKVKEPLLTVEYLPEGLPFAGDGGGSDYVARAWFPLPGPWVCEGHVMARALRRWMQMHPTRMPCDRIIVLDRPAFTNALPGQDTMHTGVMSVWREIARHYAPLVDRNLSKFSKASTLIG